MAAHDAEFEAAMRSLNLTVANNDQALLGNLNLIMDPASAKAAADEFVRNALRPIPREDSAFSGGRHSSSSGDPRGSTPRALHGGPGSVHSGGGDGGGGSHAPGGGHAHDAHVAGGGVGGHHHADHPSHAGFDGHAPQGGHVYGGGYPVYEHGGHTGYVGGYPQRGAGGSGGMHLHPHPMSEGGGGGGGGGYGHSGPQVVYYHSGGQGMAYGGVSYMDGPPPQRQQPGYALARPVLVVGAGYGQQQQQQQPMVMVPSGGMVRQGSSGGYSGDSKDSPSSADGAGRGWNAQQQSGGAWPPQQGQGQGGSCGGRPPSPSAAPTSPASSHTYGTVMTASTVLSTSASTLYSGSGGGVGGGERTTPPGSGTYPGPASGPPSNHSSGVYGEEAPAGGAVPPHQAAGGEAYHTGGNPGGGAQQWSGDGPGPYAQGWGSHPPGVVALQGQEDRPGFAGVPWPITNGGLELPVNLHAIRDGSDKRTTIMVRNVPNKYSAELMLAELDAVGLKGRYDFFYLPIDFRNRCNMGYAFLNMINPLDILILYTKWNGQRWPHFASRKLCELAYARIQGKEALVARFSRSLIMARAPPSCQPILFVTSGPRQGEREPFPTSGPQILTPVHSHSGGAGGNVGHLPYSEPQYPSWQERGYGEGGGGGGGGGGAGWDSRYSRAPPPSGPPQGQGPPPGSRMQVQAGYMHSGVVHPLPMHPAYHTGPMDPYDYLGPHGGGGGGPNGYHAYSPGQDGGGGGGPNGYHAYSPGQGGGQGGYAGQGHQGRN